MSNFICTVNGTRGRNLDSYDNKCVIKTDISPDGKAKEWPLYDTENKQMMVFDEFDIHPEKESERKILDWDRTYFLTRYYCI